MAFGEDDARDVLRVERRGERGREEGEEIGRGRGGGVRHFCRGEIVIVRGCGRVEGRGERLVTLFLGQRGCQSR